MFSALLPFPDAKTANFFNRVYFVQKYYKHRDVKIEKKKVCNFLIL